MENELVQLTQQLSQAYFHKPFAGVVRWNSRLRSSAGRFLQSQQCIELNPKYIEHFGPDSLIEVLKHELIHYHFPKAGHGPVFRREATRIGSSRFCAPLAVRTPKYVYWCKRCNKEYPRWRRIDVRKYCCSACKGKLGLR